MRVLVRGPFSMYDQDGIDCTNLAIELSKAGADVIPMPTRIRPGLPREFTHLLAKAPTGRANVMLDFGRLNDVELEHAAAAKHAVYVTRVDAMEARRIDADLVMVGEPTDMTMLKALHGLGDSTKTAVEPLGVHVDKEPVRRSPTEPMRFMVIADGVPFAEKQAMEEFTALLPDHDATMEMYSDPPGRVLMTSAHVLIDMGATRATPLFMASGGAVITASQAWGHPDAGWLIEDTAIEQLVPTMVTAYRDVPDVCRKGEVAAAFVRAAAEWTAVGQKVLRRLEEL